MRFLTITRSIAFYISLQLTPAFSVAQQQNVDLQQNSKFEQLLNEKRKINSSISSNQRYKIQVYSGNSEGAKKALLDCKQDFKELDGTLIFYTPNYKVWIGNFRTRIEAERYLAQLKRKYPNALLIKPTK